MSAGAGWGVACIVCTGLCIWSVIRVAQLLAKLEALLGRDVGEKEGPR